MMQDHASPRRNGGRLSFVRTSLGRAFPADREKSREISGNLPVRRTGEVFLRVFPMAWGWFPCGAEQGTLWREQGISLSFGGIELSLCGIGLSNAGIGMPGGEIGMAIAGIEVLTPGMRLSPGGIGLAWGGEGAIDL